MEKDKMKVWISVEMSDSLACYIEKTLKEPRKKCFLSLDSETVTIDTIELIECPAPSSDSKNTNSETEPNIGDRVLYRQNDTLYEGAIKSIQGDRIEIDDKSIKLAVATVSKNTVVDGLHSKRNEDVRSDHENHIDKRLK